MCLWVIIKQRQSIIFISSNMLDILNLALDTNKCKLTERQNLNKQEIFNQIMLKLRERNLSNDLFIKKYIKRSNRKKLKLPEIQPCLEDHSCQNAGYQSEKINQEYFEQENLKNAVQRIGKQNLDNQEIAMKTTFNNTNHTLTEQPLQEQTKGTNFPNIDSSSNKTQSQILSKHSFKPNLHNIRQDKSFNKYLKNIFFKEISQKLQSKQASTNPKENQPRKSQARLNTQMVSSKYQLSIKSLVFGIQDSDLSKRQDKRQNYQKRKIDSVTKEIIKDMQKYDRDYQFYDDRLSKGILPVIHNFQPPKNRRFLEKYIKFNNDKSIRLPSTEPKLTTLPSELQILSGRETPHKPGFGLRIQTIQVQKPS